MSRARRRCPSRRSNLAPQRPPGTPDALLALIERAARDPTVDVEKMQQLFGLRERLDTQRASIAFAEAFADLGPDLPVIDRNGQIVIYSKKDRTEEGVREGAEPIQRTRYATLDDLLEALREPLAKHGFSIRFAHEAIADGRMTTTAILRHRLGHQEKATTPPMKHDATGSKNDAQGVGSALTYGRRYALMALLPITSHSPLDADDDGRASGMAIIDADQLALLQQLLTETKSDEAKFFDALGCDGFSDDDGQAVQARQGVARGEETPRQSEGVMTLEQLKARNKAIAEGQKRAWAIPEIRARRSAAIAMAQDDPLHRASMSRIKRGRRDD